MKKVLSALGIGLLITSAAATNLNSINLTSNENFIQNNSTRNEVEVYNYDDFLTAANDTSVDVINLGSDIDLSDATPTGLTISNKTINGYGHSFFNYDYALNDDLFEINEYLFNGLENVKLNNIVFDNVIGFSETYNYNDSVSQNVIPFKNITIENIDLDESYNSSDDLGLLFNDVDIELNQNDNSELTIIDGLVIYNNSFRTENETKINIFTNTFDFINDYSFGIMNLPLFTDISILNNEVLNSNEVTVIGDTLIQYTFNTTVMKGLSVTNIVVSQNFVDSTSELSFIEIRNTIRNLFVEDLVFFNYYDDTNIEQGNTYLFTFYNSNSSISLIDGFGTVYIINNINDETPSSSNDNIIKGYKDNKISDDIKYFSIINTIQNKTDYEKINTIFDSIFGKYGLEQTIDLNGNLIDLNLVLEDSLSILKINTTINKSDEIGQITFYFSINLKSIYDTTGSVTLTNPVLRIADSDDLNNYNSYNANQSIVTDDSTPWFELSFNFDGSYKVDDLLSKQMILIADASDSSNTKKSKQIYFEIDEQEVVDHINNGVITNVLFINQAAKIATIVLTVILLIIIIILIILLILNILKKRRIAKVTETQGGYYRYVENDQISQDTYDDYNDYNYDYNYDDSNYDYEDENNY